jgi:hypothetical protein
MLSYKELDNLASVEIVISDHVTTEHLTNQENELPLLARSRPRA